VDIKTLLSTALGLTTKSVQTLYSLTDHVPIGLDWDFTGKQSEQNLIDTGYGENVTAYAIIKKIAQTGADIPKVLVDLNDPEEIIEEGEVFDMLQRPGIYQGETLSQYDYFEALITFLLSSGNTYQRGLTSIGFGDMWQKMEIIPSGKTTPLTGNSYLDGVRGYQFIDKSAQFILPTDDILHTKFINPTSMGLNSLEGLSPLQAAIFALTGSTDIQKAISIMVKNQGARGVLSNKSDRTMKEEEAKLLSDKANEKLRGLKNFNKIHVTNTEMSYEQIGMSATDLKVIESGVLTDRQLCNAYSVSSRLFNDPANSTFNNVKEATKSLYTEATIPTLNKILEDLNFSWLGMWSLRDNKRYSVSLDISGIEALQDDQKVEAEKDKIRMEGVNVILTMTISSEAKAGLLQSEYGYSEEEAQNIVAPVGTLNPTLEELKAQSPLLAKEFIKGFTPEELKALLP
jgi:HK97 family phage portal protein